MEEYSFCCDDESGLELSNRRSEDLWNALFDLVEVLLEKETFASRDSLFSWKEKQGYLASAKDGYGWRAALDEIKNSDLEKECSRAQIEKERMIVMTDKPAMLKIGGEITNGLMHSYSKNHRISFRLQ